MMLACNLPRQENLTGPALRVIATAAARGHVKKQEYDNGHTATRIYKAGFSAETMGRVTTHGRKLSYEDFLNALMRVRGNLLVVTNGIASVDCVFIEDGRMRSSFLWPRMVVSCTAIVCSVGFYRH